MDKGAALRKLLALFVLAVAGLITAGIASGHHNGPDFWLHCLGIPAVCSEEEVPTTTLTSTSTVTETGPTTTVTSTETVTVTTTTTPPPPPPPPPPSICTSEVTPGQSIQTALDAASPGDTVCVRAGNYSQSFRCDSEDSGTVGAWLTVRGYPGERPLINFAGAQVVRIACSFFELQGFDIAGPAAVGGTNIYPASGSNVRIIDNYIHGSICQGVSMDNSTSGYVFERNAIYDNGNRLPTCDQQAHGLYIQGNGHSVVNNLIYDNHDYGIQRYPRGNAATFAYNTVAYNGLGTGKSGMVIGGATNDDVVSNIFAFNGAWGIKNSTGQETGCDIHGNLFFSNPSGQIEGGFPTGCVGPQVAGDPMFAGSRDFHISLVSPAVNAGDPTFAPPADFEGFPRAVADIGAYEAH